MSDLAFPARAARERDLGVGAGLRPRHYTDVGAARRPVDFFELLSENFMVGGGAPLHHLDRVVEQYPVVLHGVSLNIGGPEPPDRGYLERLKRLVQRTDPRWVSDHFCWCGASGAHLHDLLPLPYTSAMVTRVAERARMVQDLLERPFLLENTSSYLGYAASALTEWEFIAEVVERAGIGLLLDVNNVYVAAFNHGFEPREFIRNVPHDRVLQIHLAGHTHRGTHLLDTHRGPIVDAVWELYRDTLALTGPVATSVEWDEDVPDLDVLLAELERARAIRDRAAAPLTSGS